MIYLIAALLVHLAAALLSLVLARLPRVAGGVAVGGAFLAAGLALPPALASIVAGGGGAWHATWAVPHGSFTLALDPLAALFLVPLYVLAPIATLYGDAYQRGARHATPAHHAFLHCLVGGMTLTLLAANAVLFLVAWEIMTIAAFFLVVEHHEESEVRAAGRTFLVASHVGLGLLFAFFLLLGRGATILDFSLLAPSSDLVAAVALGTAFLGFGVKAGFVPLHVWLPEAHPAAPSHVSALMSGVMIKLGIYGLLRATLLVGTIPAWWGPLLVAVGLASALLAAIHALAQADLKRALAFSSIENVGIIAMALGLGWWARAEGRIEISAVAFAGAFLHLLNHSIFKGLLFLGAGAVQQAAGTRRMDRLGGLARRLPGVGIAVAVGCASIMALPPASGFMSEFVILLAALRGLLAPGHALPVMALALIAGLGVVSGLVVGGAVRLFGMVFLGEPRSAEAAAATPPPAAMTIAAGLLAVIALAMGLGAPRILALLVEPVAFAARIPSAEIGPMLAATIALLETVVLLGLALIALVLLFALGRRLLLARRSVSIALTWDCGFAAPTARMQYTASSFAQLFAFSSVFRSWLRPERTLEAPVGLFPAHASMTTRIPDPIKESILAPLFTRIADGLAPVRRLQYGRVQVYILYIALTLVLLLAGLLLR